MTRHVYHINCDCASYYDARMRPVSCGFVRCRACHKQLGFEAYYIGRITGRDEADIMRKAKKEHMRQVKSNVAARAFARMKEASR